MNLTAYNHSGKKLAAISADCPIRLFIHLLHKQRLGKYIGRIEKEYRAKYMVYWSPITKRRYKCEQGQEPNFKPVEGALYFVGFREFGPVLTQNIMPYML